MKCILKINDFNKPKKYLQIIKMFHLDPNSSR